MVSELATKGFNVRWKLLMSGWAADGNSSLNSGEARFRLSAGAVGDGMGGESGMAETVRKVNDFFSKLACDCVSYRDVIQ